MVTGACIWLFVFRSLGPRGSRTQASVATLPGADSAQAVESKRPPRHNQVSSIRPKQQGGQFEGITEQIQTWLRLPLTPPTFAQGIAFLKDQNLSEEARLLVLDRLHSLRRRLAPDQLELLFGETERIAGDATQPEALRARSVSAMATLLVVMQEQNLLARTDVEAHFPFFSQLGQQETAPVAVRGRAIRALGILKADSARDMLRAILAAPDNASEPELIRNTCLALVQVEGATAIEPIGRILASTTDETIFGTAAFALGEIHTSDSLITLLQNKDRFPGSGSPDAVLVNMEDLILVTLQDSSNPNVVFAIKATQHLWKDGQRERYIPLLQAVLASAPLPAQEAAVERLIQDARSLSLEKEQEQLAAILPIISHNSALKEYGNQIQNRLSAKPLFPSAAPIPTVVRPQ